MQLPCQCEKQAEFAVISDIRWELAPSMMDVRYICWEKPFPVTADGSRHRKTGPLDGLDIMQAVPRLRRGRGLYGSQPRHDGGMTEIPSNIWQVPVYLPYLQPTLTAEAIAETEEQLGVKLPESYLAILKQQNGGYVRLRLPETAHAEIWGIGPYFPNIAKDHGGGAGAATEHGEWLPSNPQSLIPFDGDGHWYLCWTIERERKPRSRASPTWTWSASTSGRLPRASSRFSRCCERRSGPARWAFLAALDRRSAGLAVETILNARFEPPDSGPWLPALPLPAGEQGQSAMSLVERQRSSAGVCQTQRSQILGID